jgi:catechol 2,3-dioxygenase-like lactoylglutathione lyase family enzyme
MALTIEAGMLLRYARRLRLCSGPVSPNRLSGKTSGGDIFDPYRSTHQEWRVPEIFGGDGVDVVRSRLSGPVIGCGDASELAEFYAALLGWNVVDRYEDKWALVKSPSGDHKLEFQNEEPFVPPVWPTVAGEQQMGMHLDIAVENLAAGVDYALSLGARVAEHQPQEGRVTVMLDPAGHPFCLFPGKV